MEKLSNKEIVKILKDAKIIYINYIHFDKFNKKNIGLCYCIANAYKNKYNRIILYDDIKYIIPKFNKKFFNIKSYYCYWWLIKDYTSRIDALNKLIFYYKYKAPIYDFINKIKCIFK